MADSRAAAQQEEDLLGVIAHHLRGDDIAAALAAAESHYTANPTAASVCAMSVIAFRQGNIASAIRLLEPLCEGMQGGSDLPEALAVLNCLAGRISEALYYGKLATVQQPDGKLLPLYGQDFPRYSDAFLSIEHKPLLVRSRRAFGDGLNAEALRLAEQHLQLFRDDVEGLDHYAQCLTAEGLHHQAVGILRSVVTIAGPSATLFSRLGQALVALGDFDQGMACHRQAVTRGAKAAVLWAAMLRDWAYHPWGGGHAVEEAVTGFAQAVAAGGPKVARQPPPAQESPVITIGFLCNAPYDAGQRTMIGAAASGFDRSRVKVVGFGPGELDAMVNNLYCGRFDVWRNTHKVDELTLSAIIRSEGVDVLIDADGLAAQERLSLLLRNAAPLQYSWLNVPAGVAIPGAHGNLCTDQDGPAAGLLLSAGQGDPTPLPAAHADGVLTFGADVTLAELNAEVVRIWSAILHSSPEAVLVLADRGFQAPDAATRLVDMFGNFGVAHRIDIVSASSAQEFFSGVDVALAPFPMMRPLPYGEALSAGIPVITLAARDGSGFARALSRLGGVGESMLAGDLEQYVAAALALTSDVEKLAVFRQTMPTRFRQSALFSPAAFASEWESLFRAKLSAPSATGARA